jgi:AraC family transcriptional regulator, transcriptional activator of pobA
MQKAKQFLAESNDSIKEISLALGFHNPTNFYKFFRKHEGITTLSFREKLTNTSSE